MWLGPTPSRQSLGTCAENIFHGQTLLHLHIWGLRTLKVKLWTSGAPSCALQHALSGRARPGRYKRGEVRDSSHFSPLVAFAPPVWPLFGECRQHFMWTLLNMDTWKDRFFHMFYRKQRKQLGKRQVDVAGWTNAHGCFSLLRGQQSSSDRWPVGREGTCT